MFSTRRLFSDGRGAALLGATAAMLFILTGCPVVPPPDNSNENTNDNTSTGGKGNSGLTGKFIGSERCSACHKNIHDSWEQTLHARAYDTLEAIGQENNAACVGCHTVGFGEPGGWVDRATTNDLAGVGCESCHGGARAHAENVNDESLRPKIDISANVCGRCHTGEHHPNFEDWSMSRHATVTASPANNFTNGTNLNSCGQCHSGYFFYHARILGETVPDTALRGVAPADMDAVECAICHNPHSRTGNAAAPDEGRDYQLRYPQVKFTTPSNNLADAQNPDRFNLCGQCHHARSVVWTDSSREPHPSDQVNVFFGEMPLPANMPEPLVPSRPSVHLNTTEQCSTCHVFRKPIEEGIAPAVSGHTFEVNVQGCAATGCHPSAEVGMAKLDGLKAELDERARRVLAALDAWSARNPSFCNSGAVPHSGPCWEYTSEGGPPNTPAGQARIPNDIKKARYLYYYVVQGGGNGVHNPDYVREALITALSLAQNAPAPSP